MNRIRKALKPIRKFVHKYVNGTKGMISIFLALVMSPLLSVSLLLVESARYQSTIQMVEEIMDCAGFSSLAEYDEYLDSRFGTMAVSQKEDINSTFSNYMKKSMTSAGQSVSLTALSAIGEYPLSDSEIFRQQIQEQTEFSVPAKLLLEGFNVKDLMGGLEDKFNKATDISEKAKKVKDGADAAKYVTDAIAAIQKAKAKAETVSEKLQAYKDAYDNPNTDADFLGAVNKIRRCAEAHDEAVDYYDEANNTVYYKDGYDYDVLRSDLNDAWDEMMNTYKPNYENAAKELKSSIQDFKMSLTGANGCIAKINDAIVKLNKLSGDLGNASFGTKAFATVVSTLETVKKSIDTYLAGASESIMDGTMEDLQSQIDNLGLMERSSLAPGDGTINANWTDTTIDYTMYPPVNVGIKLNPDGVILTFANAEILLAKLAEDQESANCLKKLVAVFNSVKELSFLYDGTLDSKVDANSLYFNSAGVSFVDSVLIESLGNIVKGVEDVASLFTGGGLGALITGVIEVIVGFLEFLASVVLWVGKLVVNIGRVLLELGGNVVTGNAGEEGNKLLLFGYATYNFPNRTTYDDAKGQNLQGTVKWREVAALSGATSTTPSLSGSFMDLKDLKSEDGGTDAAFVGAELEYLLGGSKSEIQNQTIGVFNLYMMRMVLDVVAMLTNNETRGYLSKGMAGIIAFIVIALVEPLLDVFILVNPGKEGKAATIPFFKSDYIYFTATGLPHLMKCIEEMSAGAAIKGKLGQVLQNGVAKQPPASTEGGSGGSGGSEIGSKINSCNYTEHLFVLLILSVETDTLVQRMQNIVSMEGKAKYGTDFRLDHAYTYIKGNVEYTLNPMFKIDTLTQQGLFKGKRVRYAGY